MCYMLLFAASLLTLFIFFSVARMTYLSNRAGGSRQHAKAITSSAACRLGIVKKAATVASVLLCVKRKTLFLPLPLSAVVPRLSLFLLPALYFTCTENSTYHETRTRTCVQMPYVLLHAARLAEGKCRKAHAE